jgi:peptidoglycan/xylan/chitin deacetylase (PgdA/CDA1 family)
MSPSPRARALAHVCLGAASATAVGYWAPALAAVAAPARRVLAVRNRLEGTDGVLLTFDDGPHPRGTPAVLELLHAADLHATFFLVGEQAARHAAVVADIAAAGHEIGFHCHRHRCLARLTPRQVADDFERGIEAVAATSGRTPRLYRPPYGVLTAAALTSARRYNLTPLLWSRDGRDWRGQASAASIGGRVTRNIGRGDIILLHDADHYSAPLSWQRTVAALPQIIHELDRRQLHVLPFPSARRLSAHATGDRSPAPEAA